MSNLLSSRAVEGVAPGVSAGPAGPVIESVPARKAEVGALAVQRVLPVRHRRMVGPWCFFDRFGPLSFVEGKPLDVAPHPHCGLQTVSWLIQGEVLHKDSLGSESLLCPGELHLMTAGAGIAHAEETPSGQSGKLDGVQLWVALPEGDRQSVPKFAHHADISAIEFPGGRAIVIMGQIANVRSPAKTFSSLIASELSVNRGERFVVPVDPGFEHAIVILEGGVEFEGHPLLPDALHYLGTQRDELSLSSRDGARVMLVGGTPFGETIVMWWNFVARTHQEIEQAREDWKEHRRFGEVTTYSGQRLDAPPLDLRLKSR